MLIVCTPVVPTVRSFARGNLITDYFFAFMILTKD
jgi:hypothetical protein